MKLSVIGCGYLGAVHAAAMARLGHTVIGVETDERRFDTLSRGEVPFYEPGLPEMLTAEIEAGRAGDRQAPRAGVALLHADGGVLSSHVSLVMEKA